MTDLLAPPDLPAVHPDHAPPMPDAPAPAVREWRLVWRGRTYCESDMTGAHLANLAILTGTDDYESLDLNPRSGYVRLMQMLTAFVAVEAAENAEPDEVADCMTAAITEVSKAPADEILAAIRYG